MFGDTISPSLFPCLHWVINNASKYSFLQFHLHFRFLLTNLSVLHSSSHLWLPWQWPQQFTEQTCLALFGHVQRWGTAAWGIGLSPLTRSCPRPRYIRTNFILPPLRFYTVNHIQIVNVKNNGEEKNRNPHLLLHKRQSLKLNHL